MNTHSEKLEDIAMALCAFQGQLEGASKSADNPYFKSKYADLTSVWHAIKQPLADNNLCVTQINESIDGKYFLVTMLMHESGQWIKSYTPLVIDKATPQAFGSAQTYARRYGLTAVLGVTQEDDDGNAGTFISKQQLNALMAKLQGHSDIFDKVMDGIKKKNIQSLDRINHDLYNGIMKFVDEEVAKKMEVQDGTGQ